MENRKSQKSLKKNSKKITKKIKVIQKTADEDLKVAAEAKGTSLLNKTNLENLRNDFDAHKLQYDETCIKLETLEKELSLEKIKINSLNLQLEDQVNRSSRKTLVFKGIKEDGKESWSDTKELLSKVVAEVLEVDPEDTIEWIERAHRSRPNKFKKGKRDIFACFHNWNGSDHILKTFRYNGMNNDPAYQHVVVDQKYGKNTTWRRDQALLKRTQLKQGKKIFSGHVEYPAKLVVKYNKDNKDFVLHEDFSNIPVKRKATREDENNEQDEHEL